MATTRTTTDSSMAVHDFVLFVFVSPGSPLHNIVELHGGVPFYV